MAPMNVYSEVCFLLNFSKGCLIAIGCFVALQSGLCELVIPK